MNQFYRLPLPEAIALLFLCLPWFAAAQAKGYDPLAILIPGEVQTLDLSIHDSNRKRDIPILVYLPPMAKTPAPIVLFSHGLGGTRKGSSYLGKHWAARGYVAIFLQHLGSDESVWKDIPREKRMDAMKKAASLKNLVLRAKDVPFVLDQLDLWNKTEGHALAGKLDLKRIGMSGHSFGAATTQVVSGQTTARGKAIYTDERIRAALVLSPSGSNYSKPEQAFGKVKVPWMLMTGTKDVSLVVSTDMQSRLSVFPALPSGGKYELVLYDAEHSAFTEHNLPGDKEKKNPNHHKAILALSTAFWDAWLCNGKEAKSWLEGDGPSSILEKQDRWQKK